MSMCLLSNTTPTHTILLERQRPRNSNRSVFDSLSVGGGPAAAVYCVQSSMNTKSPLDYSHNFYFFLLFSEAQQHNKQLIIIDIIQLINVDDDGTKRE